MRRFRKSTLTGVSLVIVASVFAADMAAAQATDLEEIIVRARKREEPLQDVPVSISVLGQEEILRKGITDLRDAAKFTPGIIFDNGFSLNDTKLTIRGLSPTRGRSNAAILVDGIDFTTEALASAGASQLFDQRLLDLQSIEVVKGPQSALYGRSAFAGAVQYVTSDPADELSGSLNATVGQGRFGRYSVFGNVSIPLTDSLGLLINGGYYDDENFHVDSLTGGELGGVEGFGVSGKVRFDPTENLIMKARVSYVDDEQDPQATIFNRANTVLFPPPSALAVNGGPISPGPLAMSSIFSGPVEDRDGQVGQLTANPRTGEPYPGGFREVLTATFEASLNLGFGNILVLTGYLDGDSGQFVDGDKDVQPNAAGNLDIALGGAETNSVTHTEIFSQEVRFSTESDGPLQFTLGGLYWLENASQVDTGVTALQPGFPLPPPGFFNAVAPIAVTNSLNTERDTDHWSVYGVVEWDLNDRLRATFEGRYADETIDVIGASCGFTGPVAFLCGFAAPSLALETFPGSGMFAQPPILPATGSVSDSYFAPKGTIEWVASDDALVYFSVGQGIKPAGITTLAAGGFLDADQDLALDEATFDAERLLSFEIGGKTSWLDNSLILNVAAFSQIYSDRQVPVQQIVGGFPIPFVTNAAEAEVFGIELDGFWQVTENIDIQFAYAFLDAENTDFTFTSNSTNNIARAGNCVVTTDGLCEVSLSGLGLEGAPRHAGNIGIGYRGQLLSTGLDWFFEGDVRFQDERFIDEFNDRFVNAFVTADLRVGVETENWDILFFVNNVTDNDTFQNWSSGGGGIVETAQALSFFPSSGFGFIPNPRHVGVRTNIRF